MLPVVRLPRPLSFLLYLPVICHGESGNRSHIFAIFVCMEVNDALVQNLANLARLQFNEQEKEIIKKDLQRMIQFVDKLNELNTEGVEPLLHMTDAINVLREDVVQGSISREEALKNAPDTDGTFFKVPKVIKKD
jgi:aspartyl-tRNA(Asn)/glutamyl-tRNA(Gln) amidotransferase subunit C